MGAKNFSCNLYGRYVSIKIYNTTQYLTICEVKVTTGVMDTAVNYGSYYGKSIFLTKNLKLIE